MLIIDAIEPDSDDCMEDLNEFVDSLIINKTNCDECIKDIDDFDKIQGAIKVDRDDDMQDLDTFVDSIIQTLNNYPTATPKKFGKSARYPRFRL